MKSSDAHDGKVSMDHIYDNPDPRTYFRELKGLDYGLPGIAKHIVQELISYLQGSREEAIDILDVGCSYGVNAALLKHDMSMTDLMPIGVRRAWKMHRRKRFLPTTSAFSPAPSSKTTSGCWGSMLRKTR